MNRDDMPAEFIKLIVDELPQWVQACEDPAADAVLLHQGAFATSYQRDEIFLLGLAIKYAGKFNKKVIVINTEKADRQLRN